MDCVNKMTLFLKHKQGDTQISKLVTTKFINFLQLTSPQSTNILIEIIPDNCTATHHAQTVKCSMFQSILADNLQQPVYLQHTPRLPTFTYYTLCARLLTTCSALAYLLQTTACLTSNFSCSLHVSTKFAKESSDNC